MKSQGAGDESDPIAVMSVINLHQKKDTAYIKQISAYLKKKCPKDLKEQLSAVLAEKGVGLIINERVINVPQVCPLSRISASHCSVTLSLSSSFRLWHLLLSFLISAHTVDACEAKIFHLVNFDCTLRRLLPRWSTVFSMKLSGRLRTRPRRSCEILSSLRSTSCSRASFKMTTRR